MVRKQYIDWMVKNCKSKINLTMIKEAGSIYAYKVEHTKDFSFKTIMKLASDFVNDLDEEQINELFEQLKRGVDLLSTEPQMNMYLYAYGKMHEAKLKMAFENMGEDYKQMDDFAIVDYGCGQGLASIVLYDHLKALGLEKNVHKVVLIEPSEAALKRAALHVSKAFLKAEIVTVNKFLDDLKEYEINCNNLLVFHLFSNIIDVESVSLYHLAELVDADNQHDKNIVCVSPNFGGLERNKRINEFCKSLNADELFTCNKIKGEWIKDWSCAVRVFVKRNYVFHETLTVEEFKERMDVSTVEVRRNLKTKELYCTFGNNTGEVYAYIIPSKPMFSFVTKTNGKSCWLLHDKSLRSASCVNNKTENTESLSTEVTEKDLAEAWTDELGVKYSKDGKKLLEGNRELSDYSIKLDTKVICDKAFKYCEFLQSINIPNSVSSIGIEAFKYCSSLQSINIPNSVTSIGDETFYQCSSLQNIHIPNLLIRIGDKVFYKCLSLQSINIPNSVIRIGNGAFYECSSLQSINIPNSVSSIGDWAFSECKLQIDIYSSKFYSDGYCIIDLSSHRLLSCYRTNLENYTIPDSVTSIGDGAFLGCHFLQSIHIPSSVTSIGDGAFRWCYSLRSINISNSVKCIGRGTFGDCDNLQSITIPRGTRKKFTELLLEYKDILVEC